MAVLYRHIKPNGEVFYIGISNSNRNRAYQKGEYERNSFWHKIVKKYPNYEVQIISKNLSKELAFELEIILIAYYGRRDLGTGTLVNLTNGGEINTPSPEGIERIRKALLGRKVSNETKLKQSVSKLNAKIIPPSRKNTKRSEISKLKQKNTILLNGNKRCKSVICTFTNIIYNSVKDCAEKNNILKSTLTNKLNGHRKNDTTFKYFKK